MPSVIKNELNWSEKLLGLSLCLQLARTGKEKPSVDKNIAKSSELQKIAMLNLNYKRRPC